jgi:hypothetical protein
MSLDLFRTRGTPLHRQGFTWKELVHVPYSKLDDDAFTRVRVILMNGIESEAIRFSHAIARMNAELQLPLAEVRRVEQHQQTLINWLHPPDQDPLETTLGFEQVAIEVTAAIARREPDPYLAQVYRFGLLEDFDHLYRYGALADRLYGRDPNALLQGYTDVVPGRPTIVQHRAPVDDLRHGYVRDEAEFITKLHAYTVMSAEHATHDYYMHVGPMFADPIARQLYAEIASVEEQHVTQYESIIDADETVLEKWLLHEANECYLYWSCVEHESNPRIQTIWERMLDYELGHFALARDLFERFERRDAEEVLDPRLPEPLPFTSQRDFVRGVLKNEVDLRASGREIVPESELPRESPSPRYAAHVNSDGSPSEIVAHGWRWNPGGELAPAATSSVHKRVRPIGNGHDKEERT